MSTATDRTETTGQDFESTQTFGAPPEKVLAALRTSEGITGWWGPADGSAEMGGTFEVSFAAHQQVIVLHVESSEQGQVVWTVMDTPLTPEWVGTTIVFDVAAAGEGATLHFCHHGLTPQLQCFDMCHAGWTHYLTSLVSYVDSGAGSPSRHEAA
jgi:uncharacterized protein YndB with AHSA1/START domain